MQAANSKLLKSDVFGHVSLDTEGELPVVTRDLRSSPLWLRFLARRLMAREAAALARLGGIAGVPRLIEYDRYTLKRSWLEGRPMHQSQPRDVRYFRAAAKLLRQLHRCNVAHNDLAKEPNWLVDPDGQPAIIDYQLALHAPARGRLFRMLAREDLRHLLKHKRTYCSCSLTAREKRILATPAPISRIWMKTGKPVYFFVTRRLLNWADREGAGDR
jgi:RIO-like serine/threonine protein kinase